MTQPAARLTLEAFLEAVEGGRIFTVEFIKRTDGSHRVMNCRKGVAKYVKGVGRKFDPAEKKLLSVWDAQIADGANGYRLISLDSLIALRFGGRSYKWADDAFVAA